MSAPRHDIADAIDAPAPVGSTAPVAEIVAGPDCRPPLVLGAGRFVLGRDPACDIRLDDDTVAPFHAVVDVRAATEQPWADDRWSIEVVPLVGARPTRVDGDPPGAWPDGDRRRGLGSGSHVTVGSSVVEIRPGGSDRPGDLGDHTPMSRLVPDGDGRSVVHRRFTVGPESETVAIRTPDEPAPVPGPPATGLVAAFVGAAGALVVTTVVGSGVLAVFAVVAACASLLTWSGSWAAVVRARRRQRRQQEDDVARFARDLRAATTAAEHAERRRVPGIRLALCGRRGASESLVPGLWVERLEPPAPPSTTRSFRVVVGRGRRRWSSPPSDAPDGGGVSEVAQRLGLRTDLEEVPIAIGLAEGRCIAVSGRHRDSVARSIVGQLAWSTGPADLRLVIVTDTPDRWRWAGRLPHVRDDRSIVDISEPLADAPLADRLAEAVSTAVGPQAPVNVVLVDRAGDRTDVDVVLRSRLEQPGVMTLVLVDDPPSWVDEVVDIGRTGVVEHRRVGGTDLIAGLAVGVSETTAASVASWLGRLIDPEVVDAVEIPDRCGFVEAQPPAPGSEGSILDGGIIADGWRTAGDDPRPIVWLGLDGSGPVGVDLVSDGPHMLLAGTTGSGKSEFLRSLVLGLAVRCSPAHLGFVLVDYKGGAAFDACATLPHVLGAVTDLDDGLAARALCGLEAELRRRSERFRAIGASDLHEYRARGGATAEPMPRIVVVVDEFATLATEHPDFLSSLVDVAQRGRSLGVHLVLATQRPAGVVSEDIRANTALRFALRTEDETDSRDVIGSAAAAALSRRTPGRAFRRRDDGSLAEFQVASTAGRAVDGTGPTELEQVVAAIVEACALDDAPRVRPLWLPPLPRLIEPGRLHAELAVGAVPGTAPDTGPDAAPDVAPDTGPGASASVSAVAIGVVDDPAHQCRHPLTWSAGDGSLLLLGSVGAGCTSTLIALGAAVCARAEPSDVHLAVIDALGDDRLDVFEPLAHSLGTVRSHDAERLRRLLDRLVEGDGRRGRRGRPARTIVLIDGLDALWQQLLVPEPGVDGGLAVSLRHLLLRGGDLGIDVVATSRGAPLPTGFTARDTWVGALDDATLARAAGWRGGPLGRTRPGRFGIVSTGLSAQVAQGAPSLADLPARSGASEGPEPVRCLPPHIGADELATSVGAAGRDRPESQAAFLPIGLDAEHLVPSGPRLESGRHLLVVGRPGSGVTTTLRAIRRAWRAHRRSGTVVEIVDEATLEAGERTWRERPSSGDVLVIVDDAHRIVDRDGRLARLLDAGVVDGAVAPRVTVVAGVRLESFRSAYGHWTRTIAAAEHGIALATSGEPPTEVFGLAAPRRPVVAARPGLGWLVDGGRISAIQVATDDELEPVSPARGPRRLG